MYDPVPVLDASAIAELRALADGDPGLLVDVLDLFLEDAPQRLAELGEALGGGDAERLGRAAHGLKSSSAYVGAAGLAGACRELEALGRAGSLEGAPQLVRRCTEEYERARAALCALRQAESGNPPRS